jgi:S-adenosylmethionine:tRNA ribosyltransferase-isomerase
MKTQRFDFNLPQELIAQKPLEKRSDAKLLIYKKKTREIIHTHMYDFTKYIDHSHMIVFNNTSVIPARMQAKKIGGTSLYEVLLIEKKDTNLWICITKPGRKFTENSLWNIFPKNTSEKKLLVQVKKIYKDGQRLIFFDIQENIEDIWDKYGVMPTPPYIRENLIDEDTYQTVFRDISKQNSIAAPTAGLHFDDMLLEKIKKKNIESLSITLNVGMGTFLPIITEDIEDHHMHTEQYHISEEVQKKLLKSQEENKRILAVGTTSLRTLESAFQSDSPLCGHHKTDIFIHPGYRFRCVDSLLTNFHLPKSTLFILITALVGEKEAHRIYEEAINKQYRFFSFGDAMLID